MLILSGIVVSALFSALVALIKFAADPESVLPSITFWLMGVSRLPHGPEFSWRSPL